MMEKRIHKDDIDKLKWTDLGNHAYHHLQFEYTTYYLRILLVVQEPFLFRQ